MGGTELMPPLPVVSGVQFRNIPDWPGYAAGDDGSIWSSKWGKQWRKLKLTLDEKTGRRTVHLSNNGTRNVLVHQLVMLAFVGPVPVGHEVAHYPDRDPSNNSLSNLMYATKKVNMGHRKVHMTEYSGEKHYMAKLTASDVREIRQLHAGGMNCGQIARKFTVNRQSVWRIINGDSWKNTK